MDEQIKTVEQVPEVDAREKSSKDVGRRNKILMISIAGVLLISYIGVSVYFTNRFLPGTMLNERKVGGYTAERVKSETMDEMYSYTLKVLCRDGKEEAIRGSDIGLEPQWGNELEEMIEAQNGFAWPVKIFASDHLENETLVAWDEDKLEQQVAGLNCTQPENQTAPQDATVSAYDRESGFVLQPCVMGTTIDRDKFDIAVDKALEQLADSVSLEDEGVYMNPKVYDDDATLTEAIEKMNGYAEASINYQIGESTQVLDATTFGEWISLNEERKPIISKKKVTAYVSELAKRYNTCYSAKELKTSYNKTVTIGLSRYGWKVDNDKEITQIIEEIKAGKTVTRDLNYSMTANSHEGNDYGDSYVEINLTAQHLFLYKDGELVTESDFVSGNLAQDNATPTGAYGITYTQKDAVLRGDTYETPVNYWMPFAGNVGMHDATWRSRFGGTIYKMSGSHGCINLPISAAKIIFENVTTNYPVLVYELPGTENTVSEDKDAAAKVVKLIKEIGKVTEDSEKAIKKAQEE